MGEPSTALIRESQNSSIPGEAPTCGCWRSHAKLKQENCSCAHAVAGDTAKQDGAAAIRVACANRLPSLHGTFLSQRSVGRAAHPAGEEGGYKVSRDIKNMSGSRSGRGGREGGRGWERQGYRKEGMFCSSVLNSYIVQEPR